MTGLGPAVVYGLCLLTSAACAALLVRSYLRSRQPLLMWSAACFGLLALNNAVVFIDALVVRADTDLALVRLSLSLAAVSVLLFGFIWDLEQ